MPFSTHSAHAMQCQKPSPFSAHRQCHSVPTANAIECPLPTDSVLACVACCQIWQVDGDGELSRIEMIRSFRLDECVPTRLTNNELLL
jgi:hypothetical protein